MSRLSWRAAAPNSLKVRQPASGGSWRGGGTRPGRGLRGAAGAFSSTSSSTTATTASTRRPSRSTTDSSGGQNLEHAIVRGQLGGGAGRLQIDGVELVAFADLDHPRHAFRAPPAPERPSAPRRLRSLAQRRRQTPAGRGDHEPLDDDPGKERQIGERSRREGPGGVLALQAPPDEQLCRPGRRGR